MTAPAQVDYLGFLLSQSTYIEQEAYQVQYPDIQYPRLVPVDTGAYEWARTITHFSMDRVGQAAFLAGRANDIPLADVTRAIHEVGVEMAGIGYDYTIEELGQAMMIPGRNLTADKAIAARRAAEEFIDDKVLNGYADAGWDGLINNANIPRVDAQDGASNMKAWDNKTGDEIIRDLNDSLTGVWVGSRTVELADTIALGPSAMAKITNTPRSPDSDMSVRQWFMRNNIYTDMTGQPVNIVLLRGLEDAAAGNAGRMLTYRRDPMVLKLHLPMPHRFYPAQQWMLRYVVPGIFRLGGLEIRRPQACRYTDLISA